MWIEMMGSVPETVYDWLFNRFWVLRMPRAFIKAVLQQVVGPHSFTRISIIVTIWSGANPVSISTAVPSMLCSRTLLQVNANNILNKLCHLGIKLGWSVTQSANRVSHGAGDHFSLILALFTFYFSREFGSYCYVTVKKQKSQTLWKGFLK